MSSLFTRIMNVFGKKSFPSYLQSDQFDCGPVTLKLISEFYGKKLNLEQLRTLCRISPDGVSFKQIMAAAEEIGFRTLPALIDYETLCEEAPLPCIVFWRDRHFVVIYKITPKTVYVSDPSFGLVEYPKSEFLKAWHHNKDASDEDEATVLLLEPSGDFYKQEDSEPTEGLRGLLPYLKNYRSFLTQVFLGLLIGVVIQLAMPLITQSLVDKGINTKDIPFIYVLLIAQLTLFLSSSLISILRGWLMLYIGARISMLITSDYLIKLLRKSTSFFDSKTPGDILQRINDSNRLENFLNTAPESIFSYFNALIFLFILAYYSLTILLVFVIGTIIYTVWVWYFMKRRAVLDFKRFDASSGINSSLIQMINGIQEIRVNGSERRHIWSWEKNRVKYYKNAVSSLKLTQLQSIGGTFINELKNILITFISAFLVIEGEISLGAMLAIQYIIGQINGPLLSLIGFFRSIQDARLSLERFKEVEFITPEEEVLNDNTLLRLNDEADDIKLENLNFSYEGPNGEPVLKDISLTIPKGKVTAIVGNSGGGKTTLVKLLLKLYLPTSGSIRIGKSKLSHANSDSWRALCGTVMQDGYIFSDSILNNITESVSQEPVDTDRLLEAVRIANLEELINLLPAGFNSMIGPSGSSGRTLSGGQRQRVLIARAVYKNPHFLFFDEATSALDANNERSIVENLKEFQKNKTTVIIAHRLSTVKNADQIIVLDNGVIKEVGTHEELVELKGEYFNLVKNQLELGS